MSGDMAPHFRRVLNAFQPELQLHIVNEATGRDYLVKAKDVPYLDAEFYVKTIDIDVVNTALLVVLASINSLGRCK